MATATKPTKLPTRTETADDLIVEVDGKEYRPHLGETVVFRSRIRPEDLTTAIRLMSVDIESEAVSQKWSELKEFLVGRIVKTTWTDEEGKPYASAEEMVRDADLDELGWLLKKAIPNPQNQEGED